MKNNIQCDSCKCKPICKEVDNWSKYCEEHISLRKESVLFDEEPMCRYYIEDKSLTNIEKQCKTKSPCKKLIRDGRVKSPISIEFDDITSITDNDIHRLINKMIAEGIFE